MTTESRQRSERYELAVERPVTIIATAMNIILGVALAIALILKIYMLVLTDYVCEADGATLGNLIRCTATLDLVAAVLAVAAALNAATVLTVPSIEYFSRALGFAAAAAFVSLMGAYVAGDYDWRMTLASTALFAIVFAAMSWRRLWNSMLPSGAPKVPPSQTPESGNDRAANSS
ncbi:MAG: hypothetical protein F4103_16580 [Boseongicola sp. SB0673_bin_14]|nr:hypothetical protein [Boseongicola sp. SB0673_bin_14]